MKICSIDVGSGDIKVTLFEDGRLDFKKEINAVAKLPMDSLIEPDKSEDLVVLNNQKYLVGESAVHTRKSIQFNTDSFSDIKNLSPIIVKKYMNIFGECDFWVFDISLAYMDKAEELVGHLTTSLGLDASKVTIVPQGIGCKLAYQWKGNSLNGSSSATINSFFGIDIGFNTIDTFQCVKGKLTSDGVNGVEQAGIVKIAKGIMEYCKGVTDLPLSMAKEAVQTGTVTVMGKPIEGVKEQVAKLKKEYTDSLFNYLKENFSDLIAVSEGIIFFGGGAELIRDELVSNDAYGAGFVSVPEKPEYYNALGNIYYVLKREKLL